MVKAKVSENIIKIEIMRPYKMRPIRRQKTSFYNHCFGGSIDEDEAFQKRSNLVNIHHEERGSLC